MFSKLLRGIKSFILYSLVIVSMVVAFIGFCIGISFIQQKLFVKGEYITYFIKYPYSYLMFVIMIIVGNKVVMLSFKKEKLSFMSKGGYLWAKIDKILMLATIPLLYIVLTSVAIVTKDGIYDYSFYNLNGNKYRFSDVEYVDTGFIDWGKNKGEFFYNIELENGTRLKLAYPSMPQPSGRYDDDTWQEYVDIDKYIMASGAEKEASEDGAKYVQMDTVYVDKLLSVIRNK